MFYIKWHIAVSYTHLDVYKRQYLSTLRKAVFQSWRYNHCIQKSSNRQTLRKTNIFGELYKNRLFFIKFFLCIFFKLATNSIFGHTPNTEYSASFLAE